MGSKRRSKEGHQSCQQAMSTEANRLGYRVGKGGGGNAGVSCAFAPPASHSCLNRYAAGSRRSGHLGASRVKQYVVQGEMNRRAGRGAAGSSAGSEGPKGVCGKPQSCSTV